MANVIEDHYRRCDEIVGNAMAAADDQTLFIVLSDHGFSTFRRGVHLNGWLHERPSNQKRMEASHVQLHRMEFSVGAGWLGYESLSENGRDIYHMLRQRYGFDKWDCWKQDADGEWIDGDLVAQS